MGSSRKKRSIDDSVTVDVHANAIATSLDSMVATLSTLDPDRVVDGLDVQIRAAIARMVHLVAGFHPIVVIEQGRLRALPWHQGQPTYQAGIENGFSLVELVAIVAMKASPSPANTKTPPASIIEECLELAEELRRLGSLRAVAAVDSDDPLGWIGATLQITEMSMRGSSYAELLEETTRALFTEQSIDGVLRESAGFSAAQAIAVLRELHELQVRNMNRRLEASFRRYERVEQSYSLGLATDEERTDASRRIDRALQPDEIAASVSMTELARSTQMSAVVVEAVLDAFTWHPAGDGNVEDAVRAFLGGDNPLRVAPVIRTESGRALLIHPALTQAAIRERLEMILRSSSGWENYQGHRGHHLEQRTRRAFERLLPGDRARHAFQYYVPANDAEEATGPDQYTKRVEGDHLLLVGDVAVVVEDKAVALSSQSRSAASFRLRKDLTGIITKAAAQAERVVQRIRNDGGIRVHGEGWIDLQHVREIHTVAVSLEDLTSTSTATAELVKAGLISADSIPWTVSIHDLDLIADLSSHPAEFLLYLRRRRHPLATVLYTAPDELDLYLYFLEAGLYVEEDPEVVRSTFAFLPAVKPSELQRWRSQTPGVVTSRTDPLDAWYFEDYLRTRTGKRRLPTAPPKPRMSPSPLSPLIDAIDGCETPAALSIVATLLSGDVKTQQQMARHGADVCLGSKDGSVERTITVPIPTPDDGGWVLVWGTCPTGRDRTLWERGRRAYLRAKGYQLGVSRSAMFAYDGETREVFGVFYEQVPAELTEFELAVSARLKPVTAVQSVESVRKAMRGQRPQPRRKRKRR